MIRRGLHFLLALCLVFYGCQNKKNISRESINENSDALAHNLDSLFKDEIGQNKYAGVVCLITENGKTAYSNAIGYRNIEEKLPMEMKTLFRMQSMVKPIVTLGILKLCSEGKINLDDRASDYLPKFNVKKVGVVKNGVLTYVPADKPITLRHLLSHSSGMAASWSAGDLENLYQEFEAATNFTGFDHWIETYMDLPLVDQPGNGWYYGHSHGIMEYLISKITGMSHEKYLEQEIFKPLKMVNTTYQLSEGNKKELAQFYSLTEKGQFKRTLHDSTYTGGYDLMSNVEDYYKVAELLLNNGYLEGREFIKSNLILELIKPHIGLDGEIIPGQRGYAFGLGMAVRVHEETNWKGSPGDYGWGGYYNTSFWIDPEKQVIGIILTQSYFNNHELLKQVKNSYYSDQPKNPVIRTINENQ